MRFFDVWKLGIADLKKHKLRFVLNTLSIALIMMIIFALMSFCLSLDKTVDNDMEEHLLAKDGKVTVTFNGTQEDRPTHCITWDELKKLEDYIVNYDENAVINEINWARGNYVEIDIENFSTNIDVEYFGHGKTPQLIDGKDWNNEDNDANYAWINGDSFDQLKGVNPNIKIGDTIQIKTTIGSILTVEIAGIVQGENSAYFLKKYAIDNHVALIHTVNYDVTLRDMKNPVKSLKKLLNGLDKITDKMPKNGNLERISGDEHWYYEVIYYATLLYDIVISIIIVFFTVLILGILKNNAMINVFDNIKTFSLLRCIGLENKKIIGISMIESALSLIIGSLTGGALSLAFMGVIKIAANKVLVGELYNIEMLGYDFGWWLMICYLVGMLLISFVYFALTLTKSLRRKNLLQTLKRE